MSVVWGRFGTACLPFRFPDHTIWPQRPLFGLVFVYELSEKHDEVGLMTFSITQYRLSLPEPKAARLLDRFEIAILVDLCGHPLDHGKSRYRSRAVSLSHDQPLVNSVKRKVAGQVIPARYLD